MALRAVSQKNIAARAGVRRSATVRPVVCKAQTNVSEVVKKATLAASTLPFTIAASPAFALVDERLNGDGTGLPFGINDGVLGWCIFGVFTTIWAIWFNSQRDLGAFEDIDDGLKIDD